MHCGPISVGAREGGPCRSLPCPGGAGAWGGSSMEKTEKRGSIQILYEKEVPFTINKNCCFQYVFFSH